MNLKKNINKKYTLIGVLIFALGFTLTVLFLLFSRISNVYLFLAALYPSFSLISIGIFLLLGGLELIRISKMRIVLVLLILLSAFVLVGVLDALVKFLFTVLSICFIEYFGRIYVFF
jgi:hypothetical protein